MLDLQTAIICIIEDNFLYNKNFYVCFLHVQLVVNKGNKMFINSANIFKNYNTELTMGRKSFTEKIETPEALIDAVSKLKNLNTMEEKCSLLSNITTAAYNLIKIKKIVIDGEKLVDEMLDSLPSNIGNNKVLRYFALVHSFARTTMCTETREGKIAEKAREYGCNNYKSSFANRKAPANGQTFDYSEIHHESMRNGKPHGFYLNNYLENN